MRSVLEHEPNMLQNDDPQGCVLISAFGLSVIRSIYGVHTSHCCHNPVDRKAKELKLSTEKITKRAARSAPTRPAGDRSWFWHRSSHLPFLPPRCERTQQRKEQQRFARQRSSDRDNTHKPPNRRGGDDWSLC